MKRRMESMQANASQCKPMRMSAPLDGIARSRSSEINSKSVGNVISLVLAPWFLISRLLRLYDRGQSCCSAKAYVRKAISFALLVASCCSSVSQGQDLDRQKAVGEVGSWKPTEDEAKKAEMIRSQISTGESSNFSSSIHEIINIEKGLKKLFRIRLENTTDTEFSFKKISRQCNCMNVEPDEGVIGPGGSLDVMLRMQAPGKVSAAKTTSSIVFESGLQDALSHTVQIVFKYDQLVGFSTNLVELQVDDAHVTDPVQFTVPIMVGESVPADDIDVILGKCDTLDRPGFAFEIVNGSLNGTIDLSKSSLAKGGDRIFSTLIIGRNSNDQIDSVPLVIEKIDQVRIFPRFVNFVQADEKSDWIGFAHIRNQNATGGDADMSSWSCSAQIGSVSIPLELNVLNPRIGKITMKIPSNFDFQSAGNVVGSRKIDVKISVKTNNRAFALSVSGVVPVTKKDDVK